MVDDAEAAEEKEEDEAAGYRIKNKNPTQRCGEKTKQFCEIDNIKNEAILGNFLQKWKVECRADGLVPTCFCDFSTPSVYSTAPATKKVRPGHTSAAPSRKIILASLKDLDAPKRNPLRKSAP